MSHECGAQTQTGGTCKRKVRGEEGTRCPLHQTRRGDEQCSICLGNLDGPCKTLPCGHVFHRRCILNWSRTGHHTCPYCRQPFGEPQPEYKVTITIENVRTMQTSHHVSNVIPRLVQELGILTPNSVLTEIFLDVESRETLNEVLHDLGIGSL